MNIPAESTASVQDSLLGICLFAAFADGDKSESEREHIRRHAAEIGSENLGDLSRRILMQKVSLADLVAGLEKPAYGLLAYEMALGVCGSGGSVSPAEREFLRELRGQLALSSGDAEVVEKEVDEIALVPVAAASAVPAGVPAPDNDAMILKYSILNGALELLPETVATMAIIPMQMKMVYRIGKSHGVELDQAHIKEFLATAGVGIGSQVVEGFARKIMRGFGNKLGGKMAGRAADQLTGSAFSFASTYALGKVAEHYYAGGRTLEMTAVKSLFGQMRQKAEQLHPQYLPEIRQRAVDLTPTKIFSMVRGSEV